MKLIPTLIAGCYRVELEVLGDLRGSFVSMFDLDVLRTVDPGFKIVRGNRSHTRLAGAIRGLHFQREPEAEDKLVQCLRGAIFDVCVDLRPGSPTYSKWVSADLTAENQHLMLIPKGCAHGFQTLVPDCLVEYFVSGRYAPEHEGGLRWDDPALAITWPRPCSQTSERDQAWPPLGETSGR